MTEHQIKEIQKAAHVVVLRVMGQRNLPGLVDSEDMEQQLFVNCLQDWGVYDPKKGRVFPWAYQRCKWELCSMISATNATTRVGQWKTASLEGLADASGGEKHIHTNLRGDDSVPSPLHQIIAAEEALMLWERLRGVLTKRESAIVKKYCAEGRIMDKETDNAVMRIKRKAQKVLKEIEDERTVATRPAQRQVTQETSEGQASI